MAAIQGIDIDAEMRKSNEQKFHESEMRAQAFLEGRSFEEVEFEDIGFGFEVESDEEELE